MFKFGGMKEEGDEHALKQPLSTTGAHGGSAEGKRVPSESSAERERERERERESAPWKPTREGGRGVRKTLQHQGAKWLWLDVSCILFSLIFPEKAGKENRGIANNVACPCQDITTEETF